MKRTLARHTPPVNESTATAKLAARRIEQLGKASVSYQTGVGDAPTAMKRTANRIAPQTASLTQRLDLQRGKVSGAKLKASWFHPRTGENTLIGEFENKDCRTFDPPGDKQPGEVGMSLLDEETREFSASGNCL
jgi:hypothetical protein